MAKRRKKDIYTGPNLTDQYDFYENQQLEIKIKESRKANTAIEIVIGSEKLNVIA